MLQLAVSCVSSGVVVYGPRGMTEELLLTSRVARSSGGHVLLTIEHRYSLVHDVDGDARSRWQVRTMGYLYTLDDDEGREILSYHWHPAGRSHVTAPHLHLRAGAGLLRSELQKAHLLTELVTPAALLTLLVEQFDIRPRRADWAATLARADEALRQT